MDIFENLPDERTYYQLGKYYNKFVQKRHFLYQLKVDDSDFGWFDAKHTFGDNQTYRNYAYLDVHIIIQQVRIENRIDFYVDYNEYYYVGEWSDSTIYEEQHICITPFKLFQHVENRLSNRVDRLMHLTNCPYGETGRRARFKI